MKHLVTKVVFLVKNDKNVTVSSRLKGIVFTFRRGWFRGNAHVLLKGSIPQSLYNTTVGVHSINRVS